MKAKKKLKSLPKTFRGAKVVSGKSMKADALDTLIEKKALDGFYPTRELWIVIEDRALEDTEGTSEIKGFSDSKAAIRVAQALSNGNIDHRVLRVTDQVLVVGTMNTL
jgi:hypothetical protein